MDQVQHWRPAHQKEGKAIKNPLGNGFVLAGLHGYAKTGTYTLTLGVTDQGGSHFSKIVTFTVK